MFSKDKMVTKKLKKVCKHLKIRLTVMRNGKRFPKSEKVLLKEVKKKMKKVRFGAEKIEPWHKRHRKKLKIAAGVLAAAALIGGGHYAATRTQAGQKHLAKYNEFMKTTGKNIKQTGSTESKQKRTGSTESKPKPKPEPKVDPLEEAHKKDIAFYTKQLNDPNTPPEQKNSIEREIYEKEKTYEQQKQQKEAEAVAKTEAATAKRNEIIIQNVASLAATAGGAPLNISTGNPLLDPMANQVANLLAEQGKKHIGKLMEGGEEVDKLKEQLVKAQEQGDDTTELEQQIAAKEAENQEVAEETAEQVAKREKLEKLVERITKLNEKLNNPTNAKGNPIKLKPADINRINTQIAKLQEQVEELGNGTSFGKHSLKVLQRMAKQQGIKITFKRGGKRFYKSAKVLEKSLRKSSFGKSYRERIYQGYHSSKKKFYEVSKIIAKGMLSGIGIFTGLTISIIALFKYMEYRKIKLDPMVVLRLFKATDSKGNLHVDKFVNSAKRTFDTHAPHFVGTLAKEVRKEVPGVVQEATMSGLGVIQQNSMTLMMPMMMALSGYFSKQMGDLTVASAKKNRNESGKKGWETRRKNEGNKVSCEILSDIVNNSYQTAQRRNAAAKKIQEVYKRRLNYKRHLREHGEITPSQIKNKQLDAINKLREQLKLHRFGRIRH
jgi:hypothetical protein